jgi:hypothetical protein
MRIRAPSFCVKEFWQTHTTLCPPKAPYPADFVDVPVRTGKKTTQPSALSYPPLLDTFRITRHILLPWLSPMNAETCPQISEMSAVPIVSVKNI